MFVQPLKNLNPDERFNFVCAFLNKQDKSSHNYGFISSLSETMEHIDDYVESSFGEVYFSATSEELLHARNDYIRKEWTRLLNCYPDITPTAYNLGMDMMLYL